MKDEVFNLKAVYVLYVDDVNMRGGGTGQLYIPMMRPRKNVTPFESIINTNQVMTIKVDPLENYLHLSL